jgi:hypothetical protein
MNLPGMTGLELLRHLRRHGRPVEVLLVSGADDPTLVARVKAEGGEAFLSKTMSPRLFLMTVRQTLARILARRSSHRRKHLWNRLLPGPGAPAPGRSIPMSISCSGTAAGDCLSLSTMPSMRMLLLLLSNASPLVGKLSGRK